MKKIWNWVNKQPFISVLIVVITYIFMNIGFIISCKNKAYNKGYNDCLQELKDKYSTPVERIVIDSIYITRDSIIERTKYIKVIQHDTIEKVYNLNADSTLELFYKLVSE